MKKLIQTIVFPLVLISLVLTWSVAPVMANPDQEQLPVDTPPIVVVPASPPVAATPPNAELRKIVERREAFYDKYLRMKEAYQQKIKDHEAARKHFLELRQEYLGVKDREEVKMLMMEQVRRYLENTIDSLIKRIEALKERMNKMPTISGLNKEKINADLNNDLNWLKGKWNEAGKATELDALKDIAEEVRGYWKGHQLRVKEIVGFMLLEKAQKVVVKAEKFPTVVNERVAKLKSLNVNVARLEAWLDEYNRLVLAAKEKVVLAKAKFEELGGGNWEEDLPAFKEGMDALKEAKDLLLDARHQMKEIIEEIKALSEEVVVTPEDNPESENPDEDEPTPAPEE